MSNLDALNAAVAEPTAPRPRRRLSDTCKRSLNKRQTRERILTAAADLFSEVGYRKATIRALAARIGMSTGAVFANFPDKDAIYREIHGHAPLTADQGLACLSALAGLMTGIDADNRVSDQAQDLALSVLRSIDPDWRAAFRAADEAAAEREARPC